MADEKLNTGPEVQKIEEAPAPAVADPAHGEAPVPEHPPEQAGPAEPGDVVISAEQIDALMAEKRQAARAEVEKAEASREQEAGAPAPEHPAAESEKAEKPRRGRPPKSDKTERPGPEAEKEPKKAGPRKGRPSKADKAAPDKAQPSQRDKLSRSGGKAPEALVPPDAGKDTPAKEAAPPEQGVTEPTAPPRPVEEGKLVYLKLSELHPFHTFRPHPFKVRDDAKMQETVASIKLNGVMVPGLARPEKDGNGYEIVAGHRRCRGSELAGLEEMPFIVRDMTDHEAVEAMKDSNKQRDQTLPSELAALLDLEVEDIKHQGSRLKGVADGDVGKRSVEIVGEAHGMNYKKVMRYLRLNHLVPELMDREGGTMSRTKNRGFQQSFSPSYTIRRWRLGEYIRLSKEDLKKGKDDSNSVKNQRDLLNDFYQKHIEEFESVSEYVDDGHTGTDANRENFQRLLADVMSGKINCVVVKDLSRFARNYSDAGSLIDNLFVQMGVRFISLAENVDSYLNPDSVSSIIVPITNVMNDQYCYQTSKKIRQVFDYKRRNGQYIGSFAPYGYIKDPKDKHQLIVDPEAAEIVKLIYNKTLQGETRRAIVYHLNDHGIPSPTTYRKNKGLPYSCSVSDNPMWGDRVLTNILTNPIYTGDLVQGRRRVKSYKVHEIEAVPEDEWVRVADTHEAIIDRETFEKVQALLKRDTRTAPRKKELHLFSGFLRCADCGKSITRSQSGKNVYYACSTYKYRSRTACSMHSIKHERLEAAVLFAVRQQVHLAVSFSEILARINSAPVKKSQSFRLDDLIAAKEKELAKITRYKQSLYQDWKDGEITQQDYRTMKADYERQISSISDVLERLTAERAELANGVDSEYPALVAFKKHQNIETLNREILIDLVNYIKVYENGNISVKFKFADEFRRIAEYIEINISEIPAAAG